MPRFIVTVYCTCSVDVTVEAEDKRAAIAKVGAMTMEEMGIEFTDTGVEGIDNFATEDNYTIEEMK